MCCTGEQRKGVGRISGVKTSNCFLFKMGKMIACLHPDRNDSTVSEKLMVEEIEKRIGGLTSLVRQEGWDPANREKG